MPGASLVVQSIKNPPHLQYRRPLFNSWVRKIRWRRDRLPTLVFLGFPGGSADKESACNAGDLGLIPGLGRPPGEGNSCPLQYPRLENSMDCIVHGITESQTFTFRFSLFHCLETSHSCLDYFWPGSWCPTSLTCADHLLLTLQDLSLFLHLLNAVTIWYTEIPNVYRTL